jgi:hypothetical protein
MQVSIKTPLGLVSLLMVATLLAVTAGLALDPRVIAGQPAWLKPAKFAVSIAVYCGTLLWLLGFVRGRARLVGVVSWTTALGLGIEEAIIAGQAARGRASHFNNDAPLDAALFSLMGLTIVVVFLAAMLTAVLLLRQRAGDPALAWGLRLGVLGSLVGMAVAVPMILIGAHTVGAADGGAGLPVVGWSTVAGDLRPAHFLGLHALQVLPLAAWWVGRLRVPWLTAAHRVALVWTAGAAHTGLVVLLTWQALRGQPLTAPDVATTAAALLLMGTAIGCACAIVAHAHRGPALAPPSSAGSAPARLPT